MVCGAWGVGWGGACSWLSLVGCWVSSCACEPRDGQGVLACECGVVGRTAAPTKRTRARKLDLEALNARLEERRAELLQKAEDERDAGRLRSLFGWDGGGKKDGALLVVQRGSLTRARLALFCRRNGAP